VRTLFSFFALHFAAAAVCTAQTPTAPVGGLQVPVGILHAIALDIDQRRDALYCYFGERILTPTLRVRVDSVTTVAAMEQCTGVGFAFTVRTVDRALLADMVHGVIDNNPRFKVVSAFYATEDIDRWGDTVRVARPLSMLRGVATTTLTSSGSSW
jgi:hypothetical protein